MLVLKIANDIVEYQKLYQYGLSTVLKSECIDDQLKYTLVSYTH